MKHHVILSRNTNNGTIHNNLKSAQKQLNELHSELVDLNDSELFTVNDNELNEFLDYWNESSFISAGDYED